MGWFAVDEAIWPNGGVLAGRAATCLPCNPSPCTDWPNRGIRETRARSGVPESHEKSALRWCSAPQILDPGRPDAVAGPSSSCGVIGRARIVVGSLADLDGLFVLSLRSRRSVNAENRFLRRQLALYQGRGIKARRVASRPRRPPIPLELR